MRDRGYPLDDVDNRADLVATDHAELAGHYRAAHEVGQRGRRRARPRSCARRSCTTGRCSSSCSPSRRAGTSSTSSSTSPSTSRPGRPRPPEPPTLGRVRPLVVGFDLDMTLIDTRPGIAAVLGRAVRRDRRAIDSRGARQPARAAAGRGARATGSRRTRSPPRATGSARSTRRSRSRRWRLLPGAREAVDAVRRHGGPVVVVTGEVRAQRPAAPRAPRHSRSTSVVGWLWGPRQGRGAARARRDRLRRRPRRRHRRCPRRGCASASASRPGRSAPTSCGRPAPTSSSTTCTAFPAWLDELRARAPAGRPGRAAARARVGRSSRSPAAPTRRSCSRRRCGRWAPTTWSPRPRSAPACRRPSSTPAAAVRRRPRRAPRAAGDRRDGAARATAPTPATAATSARPSCSTCWGRSPPSSASRTSPPAPTPTTPSPGSGRASGPRPSASAVTPLLDAGLTKAQVRAASRRLGAADLGQAGRRLPVQPGRLRPGDHAGPAGPGRAGRGGGARGAGGRRASRSRDLRVRDLGDRARLEVDADAVDAVAAERRRARRRSGPRASPTVEVDPRGFRSGSMNELLPDPERATAEQLRWGTAPRAGYPGRPRSARHARRPPDTIRAEVSRAYRQGQVVRRREGLRLPVPRRRRRRLRAPGRAARPG